MIDQPKRILYAIPRGIGDFMFSLPLLHSLRSAYSKAEIFTPIPKDKQKALKLVGLTKESRRYLPKPSEDPLAMERWRASVNGDKNEKYRLEKLIYEKYLEGEQFDLALIPKDFKIDSIDCPRQICDNDLGRAGIDGKNQHMVDRFLGFACYIGIPGEMCFDLNLNLTDPITLTNGQVFDARRPYIVLNIGASTDKRVWNYRGYQETTRWALKNGLDVVVVGDSSFSDVASRIKEEGNNVSNLILSSGYLINLENLARLAYKSKALVSPDTGPLHIADAAGARVVGLYGPTSPIKFGPYHNMGNVVSRNNSDKNVQNISSREVIKKIEEVTQR